MTITETTTIPTDVRSDFEAVVDRLKTGKPLDPAIERRIEQRAQKIRQRLLKDHGLQDVGVQIIREIRGEFVDE